jgi:hypothetical protein
MKQVFKEGSVEQQEFEECIHMYNKFKAVIAEEVDCTKPDQIIEHFTAITSMMVVGILAKAKFNELTDKLCVKNMMSLNAEAMSENEKKVRLAFSIGDCSFYNIALEMLLKSAYAKIEMLQYSLQYHKK